MTTLPFKVGDTVVVMVSKRNTNPGWGPVKKHPVGVVIKIGLSRVIVNNPLWAGDGHWSDNAEFKPSAVRPAVSTYIDL